MMKAPTAMPTMSMSRANARVGILKRRDRAVSALTGVAARRLTGAGVLVLATGGLVVVLIHLIPLIAFFDFRLHRQPRHVGKPGIPSMPGLRRKRPAGAIGGSHLILN